MSRRRLRRSATWFLLLLILLPAGVAAAEGAASPGESFDRQLLQLRVVIAALTAALLGIGFWLDRHSAGRYRRVRGALLAIFAVTAFCANYNFFLWPHRGGVHGHDVFHYYLGAKYFPELGYYDLYRCTVAADAESRPGAWKEGAVRDLRSNRVRPVAEMKPTQPRCDGVFSPERWVEFSDDVRWFHGRLPGPRWDRVLVDLGYNPSPVWTLIGRPVAEAVSVDGRMLRFVAKLDLLILVAMFAVVGWCFGFPVMCLTVIFWATNPLSRYQWIGDSLLRYPWLATSLVGICLLYRSRDAAAGACLATATLLRLFPGFQIATYAVHQGREAWRRRQWSPRTSRFAAGAVGMSLVLIVLSLGVTQRGFDAYASFGQNITRHAQLVGSNSVGLRPLLSFSSEDAEARLQSSDRFVAPWLGQERKRDTFASRRWVYAGILAVFGLLLWRTLGRCQAWEAAALGVVPALLLPKMSCYYLAAMVVMALLSARRPRIAIATLFALVAWGIGSLYFFGEELQYVMASVVALALVFYVLIEMQFEGRHEAVPPIASPGSPATG